MSTYAIGDLQGCFLTLQKLLGKIEFKPSRDHLWFVGDLVNRGEGSLDCLRFIHQLGDRAVCVLGNHDLHLLAVAEGFAKASKSDTLQAILDAPDRSELLGWLRTRKLLHIDGPWAMVHAGLMPEWTWQKAQSLALEVESVLSSAHYRDLLQHMYGAEPDHWRDDLLGKARTRVTINAMTRMRALSLAGRINLTFKGGLDHMPAELLPWFRAPTIRGQGRTIVAGHWSALGMHSEAHFIGLDSGCVWGRELSAIRLEDRRIYQVASVEPKRTNGTD